MAAKNRNMYTIQLKQKTSYVNLTTSQLNYISNMYRLLAINGIMKQYIHRAECVRVELIYSSYFIKEAAVNKRNKSINTHITALAYSRINSQK